MPQGTIKSYDPTTGTAVLVDDHLVEMPVDHEAVAASGLLELRIGQRVRFEMKKAGEDDRVANLNIVSL